MRFLLAERPLKPLKQVQIDTAAPKATKPSPMEADPALWYWRATPPTVPDVTVTVMVAVLEVEPPVPVTVTV